MFAATYPECQLVAAKAGFDFSLQVNVDLITPANACTCGMLILINGDVLKMGSDNSSVLCFSYSVVH